MNNLEQELFDLRAYINNLYWKKDNIITNIDLLKKDIASLKLQRKDKKRKLKLIKYNFSSLMITSIINLISMILLIIFPNLVFTIILLLSCFLFVLNSVYIYNNIPNNKRGPVFNIKKIKNYIKSLDKEISHLSEQELDTQLLINESKDMINELSKVLNEKRDLELSYINSLYKLDIKEDYIVNEKRKSLIKKR